MPISGYCTFDYCSIDYCDDLPVYEPLNLQMRIADIGTEILGFQYRLAVYNTTNLRILWEIASDGDTADNYTASSEASTDKGILNVKSDIVEQYWQTTDADDEYLWWDSGTNRTVYVDTLGLISTNLTSSAVLTLKAYGTLGNEAAPDETVWGSSGVTIATIEMPIDPDIDNVIYVAPTLPTQAYRYYRIEIQDPTNSDGYIRIGRVVAGSALIFNVENCIDEIDLVDESYKDRFELNGFSSISNNRALKRSMTLSFRDLDTIQRTNYRLLKKYVRYCRDSLKALVVVDPSTEDLKYRFSVFSKLSAMPRERHKFIDDESSYATFDLSYEEAR